MRRHCEREDVELLDGTLADQDTTAMRAALEGYYRGQAAVSFTDLDGTLWENAVLVYDEGPGIGLGHRRRCEFLAEALRRRGVGAVAEPVADQLVASMIFRALERSMLPAGPTPLMRSSRIVTITMRNGSGAGSAPPSKGLPHDQDRRTAADAGRRGQGCGTRPKRSRAYYRQRRFMCMKSRG